MAANQLVRHKRTIGRKSNKDRAQKVKQWREIFNRLAPALRISKYEDWYSVTLNMVIQGAQKHNPPLQYTWLLKEFGGSLHRALQEIHPEHNWQGWKFQKLPKGYWESVENQKQAIEYLEKELNIRSFEDWYRVSHAEVERILGHKVDHVSFLQRVFPFHSWRPWLFVTTASPTSGYNAYFKSVHQANLAKEFCEMASKALNIDSLSHWYYVQPSTVKKLGGQSFIRDGSMFDTLKMVYPNHEWLPWKFLTPPTNLWSEKQHREHFLQWLATRLKFTNLDDYYRLRKQDIIDNGGKELLARYPGGEIIDILRDTIMRPDNSEWVPWKMQSGVPRGFWSLQSNVRSYFDWLAKQLHVQDMDGWYHVRIQQVIDNYGSGVMQHFGKSLENALVTAYPEHKWESFKFEHKQNRLTQQQALQSSLQEIGARLGVRELHDWYNVRYADIERAGGKQILEKSGGLFRALSMAYPSHQFKPFLFINSSQNCWNSESDLAKPDELIDTLKSLLNITSLDQWYGVTDKQLSNIGFFYGIKKRYGSLPNLLKEAFPQHEWDLNKFARSSTRSVHKHVSRTINELL